MNRFEMYDEFNDILVLDVETTGLGSQNTKCSGSGKGALIMIIYILSVIAEAVWDDIFGPVHRPEDRMFEDWWDEQW